MPSQTSQSLGNRGPPQNESRLRHPPNQQANALHQKPLTTEAPQQLIKTETPQKHSKHVATVMVVFIVVLFFNFVTDNSTEIR